MKMERNCAIILKAVMKMKLEKNHGITGRNVKDEVGKELYHHSESSNEDEDGKVTIESKGYC